MRMKKNEGESETFSPANAVARIRAPLLSVAWNQIGNQTPRRGLG